MSGKIRSALAFDAATVDLDDLLKRLPLAIAYRAMQNGYDASFATAAALIEGLSRASAQGKSRESLAAYPRPHVLMIDEVC